MSEQKKVVIIGAGLAGMSAGCFLRMNGFDTEIYEMHKLPGGLCTSWKRNGFLIDGCIHFMTGTAPGEATYKFWNDLIDMSKVDFVYHDTHSVAEDEQGNKVRFFSNVDQLKIELLSIAPEDKKMIMLLTSGIRKFLNIKLPVSKPPELVGMFDGIKIGLSVLPYARSFMKYVKIKNSDFVDKIKNPTLKSAFRQAFIKEQPLLYTIMPFVWRHRREMGYPKGGAIYIAREIENRFKNLGGKIFYDSKVRQILTENDKTVGIELENGQRISADIVVSASDGRSTVYDLLSGKYIDEKVRQRYETGVFETIDKTLYIALGLSCDFSKNPHKLYFTLKKPIYVDPLTTLHNIEYTHYCYDEHSAPQGKSLLTLMPDAKDWKYWVNLRNNNKNKYDSEKQRIANEIIDALETRFGNVKQNVEMVDVASPATYIRYTGNWTGGQISWKATPKLFGKPTAWQIDGLKNFYMTGQWAATAGGIGNVVMMGNHLTQIICKHQKKKFKRFSANEQQYLNKQAK